MICAYKIVSKLCFFTTLHSIVSTFYICLCDCAYYYIKKYIFPESENSSGVFCFTIITKVCLLQVMLTLLTHLELGAVQYLRLFPQINVTCTLNFHKVSGIFVFKFLFT